jgi:hypothetical protein
MDAQGLRLRSKRRSPRSLHARSNSREFVRQSHRWRALRGCASYRSATRAADREAEWPDNASVGRKTHRALFRLSWWLGCQGALPWKTVVSRRRVRSEERPGRLDLARLGRSTAKLVQSQTPQTVQHKSSERCSCAANNSSRPNQKMAANAYFVIECPTRGSKSAHGPKLIRGSTGPTMHPTEGASGNGRRSPPTAISPTASFAAG